MLRHIRSFVLLGAVLAQTALVPPALAVGAPAGVVGDSPAVGLVDTDPVFAKRGRDLKYPDAALTSEPPRFVHQTWNNCAFASASMLIDKWTGGALRPSQDDMRAASGVPQTDGVGFSQLSRAVAAVTKMDMRFSPRGGDALTWDELMSRLAKGAGAVIAGDYSDLPPRYQRWAPGFAALGPKLSGHAMYIEQYQPNRDGGRVWLMDPLGRGKKFAGEWIPAKDLRAFAWRYAGGFVAAAATPEPQPLSGYRIRDPQLANADRLIAGKDISVRLPLRVREGWRTPKDLNLAAVWQPILLDPANEMPAELSDTGALDPGLIDPVVPSGADTETDAVPVDWDEDFLAEQLVARQLALEALENGETSTGMIDEVEPEEAEPETDAEAPADEPTEVLSPLTVHGRWLQGEVRAPSASGLYRLSFELRDADGAAYDEDIAPKFQSVDVRLLGELAGTFGDLTVDEEIRLGSVETVTLDVANIGTADWTDDNEVRLVATWETDAGPIQAGSALVDLNATENAAVSLDVLVPSQTSTGTLVLELISVYGLPFTELGLEPTRVDLEFFKPAPVVRAEHSGPLDTN